MEFIRRRIETQVMSLTGLALGQLDLENPKGDPGLYGPAAICWQVHGDFPSMLIGGISALLLRWAGRRLERDPYTVLAKLDQRVA